MKRRALLRATGGTVGALGVTGCLQELGTSIERAGTTTDRDSTTRPDRDGTRSPESGASQDDSREVGLGDADWNSRAEAVRTVAVGDRDSVAFPDSNKAHSVVLWNRAGEERDLRVEVVEPRALDAETVGPLTVPGDTVVVLELNVPARYALAVAVDGTAFGSLVVEQARFDCNYSSSR